MAEGSGELRLLFWDLADVNLRYTRGYLCQFVQRETKDLSCWFSKELFENSA